MSKVKSLKLIIFAMIVLSVLFPFVVQSSIENNIKDKRSDRIVIQLGAELSKAEMPAVGFSHDLHTQAVKGKCTACHEEFEDGFVFKFKRTDEPGTMEIYHDGCFACHTEKKAAKEKSGPLEAQCRACHVDKPTTGSSWEAIDFNRSLHYTHEKASAIKGMDKTDQNNCSACHHKANEKTKEIFFAKGEEESCTYCHKADIQNHTRSLRDASHDSCVKCHQILSKKDVVAGPISCEGCHTIEKQQTIEVKKDIPRLERHQPDVVAIKGWKDDGKTLKSSMDAVAFNHKAHETSVDSCKSCHHQTLKKCNDCHDADGGTPKGGFVSLGQAMHDANSSQSCVGCHQETTKSKDCAGCHAMTPVVKNENPESCKKCHVMTPGQLEGMDTAAIAQGVATQRTYDYEKVPADKIPETVTIDILSKEYKPSVVPHKKMVDAIVARVENSQMAKAFHKDEAGLCMGCHHNSPKTLAPPKCASCHSKNSDGADGMPGLKGAYHGQCISCHQNMKVESVLATDCVKCHEAKK